MIISVCRNDNFYELEAPKDVSNHTTIYYYLAFALIISYLPFIKIYAALCNTLIHEMSHLIFSRRKLSNKIALHHDGTGLATTHSNWLMGILVSYSGYTGSSLSAVGLFYLMHKGYYASIVYVFIALVTIAALLWIRNFFGFVWAISVVVLLTLAVYQNLELLMMHISMLLSSIILVQSITTAFMVFKLSLTQRKNAGDATDLARATWTPALLWGTLFFGQSLYAGYFIFKHFFR
jgi:hypothetical protein